MTSAYTEEQVDRYLRYISVPEEYYRGGPKHSLNLQFLTMLHVHQISTIPYENLSLHYSKSRQVSLDPQKLYEKMMKNGRGGYCMENTIFFKHVLLGLGFDVYSTGARIRLRIDGIPQGDYIGWVHSVNIVTLPNGARYVLDVSFGGDGATKPLPLDVNAITRNMGTQDIRLAHEHISGQTRTNDPSQRMWVYQYRNAEDRPWNSFYAFPELEFLEQDFEVMNYFTSQSLERSFQTYTVLAVKFLRRETEPDVYGKIMLAGAQFKRNDGGKTSLVKTCETDNERVAVLKDYFGIDLTAEERNGIKGLVSELKKA